MKACASVAQRYVELPDFGLIIEVCRGLLSISLVDRSQHDEIELFVHFISEGRSPLIGDEPMRAKVKRYFPKGES